LVLWSTAAKQSQWVDHEVALFAASTPFPGSKSVRSEQRMIFVLLDTENQPYNHLQQIADFKDANVYALGANQVDAQHPNLWPNVVNQVYNAVTDSMYFTPVPLLILATTYERLASLDVDESPQFADLAPSLGKFLADVDIAREQLLNQYGGTNAEWKPFAGSETIMTILNREREILNASATQIPFRWVPLSDKFWSSPDPDDVEAEINKMLANPSVIVIDPISLYDGRVFNRFRSLNRCFASEKVTIVVLSPFAMSKVVRAYRDQLKKLSLEFYTEFYEPGIRLRPNARWHISFGDDLYLKRSILTTLRTGFDRRQIRASHPYLSIT